MWLTNVDVIKAVDFRSNEAEKFAVLMDQAETCGAHTHFFASMLQRHENCVWFHIFHPRTDGTPSDAMDVNELTRVDIEGRKKALITYDFYRDNVPGFENATIMTVSPQLGLQGGRRVIGEYTLTESDLTSDEVFADTIAVFANNDNGPISAAHPALRIPYRTMVPRSVDGLLVACRAYSTSDAINHHFNIIPHCIALGQAAGTAAAMAASASIQPRQVDYAVLQQRLKDQGVYIG
jgi:hypothetical protein